jgi:hypothetical protein
MGLQMSERKSVTREIRVEYRKSGKKARPKNRPGKPVYTQETVGALEKIRAFYNGKCGTKTARETLLKQIPQITTRISNKHIQNT